MRKERKVQWELMLKHELDEAASNFPAVYIGLGLCEPHGLYNPLGLDALKAHGLILERFV
jgi:creatinine amidohydrolase